MLPAQEKEKSIIDILVHGQNTYNKMPNAQNP
jgi:hypothetical protein